MRPRLSRLYLLLCTSGLLGACSNDPAPESVRVMRDAAEAPDATAFPGCALFLADVGLAALYGPGTLRDTGTQSGPFLVSCEYRLPRGDAAGESASQQVVLVQVACGVEGRTLRKLREPRPRAPGDELFRPHVGFEAVAVVGRRIGATPQVRLMYESAVRSGCQVRVEAPRELRRALKVARRVERSLHHSSR